MKQEQIFILKYLLEKSGSGGLGFWKVGVWFGIEFGLGYLLI